MKIPTLKFEEPGNLTVLSNVNLTLDPGVELRVPQGAHIRVQGMLNLRGTQERPILIAGRTSARWGGISFERAGGISFLSHASIEGATRGIDPSVFPSAISGLDSHLVLEFLDLTKCEGPVFARRGSTILRDSVLHTPYSGDCINVKGGFAEVSRCTFLGNNAPDTDAIDYDGVVNGIIRDNRIYRFVGSNSDGIDCGERCVNLLVEGNRIYYNSDKGISVGQGSTVTLRQNLIVGCTLGAGVKDKGSILTADQNTFVGNQISVAVYEKNFGDGGGEVLLVNNIFSRSAVAPVTGDGFSSINLAYCLSDTVPISGTGNIFADSKFLSAVTLNFELRADSPARDAGDPAHPPDADGSRADIGAGYRYSPEDYPYPLRETVVINEVLANSKNGGDWIELHNRTPSPIDLSGWFLSDGGSDLKKYRIAQGTVIAAGAYLVFYEHLHFGAASNDPGRITPFALDDSGETVHLVSASGETLTGYESQESFGPALAGVSLGSYYKPETDSYNFVPLAVPTPGAPNSAAKVGPIVISEIFYSPEDNADEEFIELLNISPEPVPLFDEARAASWKMTDGIEFSFPTNAPVTFAAGERIVLARNLAAFTNKFGALVGTRVFEWNSGKLDNSGETLQLARPGPLNASNVVQFARIDRVNYGASLPWPVVPEGGDFSLNRINEHGYGNTFLNWQLAAPTPGAAVAGGFQHWLASAGIPTDRRGENDDPDLDGIPNLLEYALGSNPMRAETSELIAISSAGPFLTIEFAEAPGHEGVVLDLESVNELGPNAWTPVSTTATAGHRRFTIDEHEFPQRFFRLHAHRSAP
ncbi:MAG: hypothetical protein EXS31_12215 [Pedosphaera sp.]|nr:hypothetical protein [Pedosphaera sp.]